MTTGAVSGLTVTFSVESTPLGAAANYTLTLSQGTIDATSDDSSRWGEYLVGRRDWTIDSDFLYIYTDTAAKYLEEHITSATPTYVTVILTLPDGRTYSGDGIVTSFTITSGFEETVKASISIQGTDALTTSTSM